MHEAQIIDLLVLTGAATFVATLFYFLRLPTVVGFIVAGVLVGPYGLSLVANLPGAKMLSEIATILLMFSIGLEIPVRKLLAMRRSFLYLGGTQVLASLFAIASILYLAFDLDLDKSLFFGALSSLSSTAIIIKLLEQDRDLNSPYGQASMGALVFQDVAVIPMMIIVGLWGGGSLLESKANFFDYQSLALSLGKWISATAFLWIGSKYVTPFIFQSVLKTKSKEIFFFTVALICVGTGALMHTLGLSVSLGAFAAGIMISDSSYGKQVVADVRPLRDNILSIFFVSIGMLLDLNFVWHQFFYLISLAVLVFGLKIFITYLSARISKYTHSISLMVSLMMFQIGEFSLVIAGQAFEVKLIDSREYQFVLALTIVSLMLTPFIYKYARESFASKKFANWNLWSLSFAQDLPPSMHDTAQKISEIRLKRENEGKENHTVVVGYGYAGRNLVRALEAVNLPFNVLEMNVDLLAERKKDERFILGDATSEEILEHAGVLHAKLVVIAISGIKIIDRVVRAVRNIRGDIPIIIRSEYIRDYEQLTELDCIDVVVSELESSLELVSRCMRYYGASWNQIREFTEEMHKGLIRNNLQFGDSARRNIHLPNMEAITGLKTIVLKDENFETKSIFDLRLRELTGATIVALYREGEGMRTVSPSTVLQRKDVLYVIGSVEEVSRAEVLLFNNSGQALNQEKALESGSVSPV